MERNIEIRTPESIAFSYELAGLGSRFLAMFIDLSIQILILAVLFIAFLILAAHLPHVPRDTSAADPSTVKLGESVLIAFGSIFFFLLFYGYFVLFETFWDGRTPGKKLLGIRVVRDGGYPVDFASALIRNIVRIGEQVLGFYVLSAICTVLSPENKRIGDYAAGTIVVRETKYEVFRNIPGMKRND